MVVICLSGSDWERLLLDCAWRALRRWRHQLHLLCVLVSGRRRRRQRRGRGRDAASLNGHLGLLHPLLLWIAVGVDLLLLLNGAVPLRRLRLLVQLRAVQLLLLRDPVAGGEGVGVMLRELRVAHPIELLLRRRVRLLVVREPRPRVSGKRVGGVPGGHRLRDQPGGATGTDCGGGHLVGPAVPAMLLLLWLLQVGMLLLRRRVFYDWRLLLLRPESGILLQVHLLKRLGGRQRRGRCAKSASAILD